MIALFCLTLSCTKEGDVGPRGEPGIQGVDGEDGTRIYTGSTAPSANVGNIGDFYFRTSNANFYGPKTADGWGTPVNLRGASGATGAQGPRGATGAQGPRGPAGAAGSKIHSGTAVPAGSLGAAGDFYFRTTTGDFYGPKTGTNWGTPINLKGVRGEDGSRIYSGTTVPASPLGNVGDFYFRTTTGDFYGPKTAAGWGTPTSLRGATGATGPQGPAGTPGSRIHSGTGVPAASLGVVGDFYLRTSNATLYGPKTAAGWGAFISLRGPAGPQGPQGPPGTANVIYSDWIPTPCTDCSGFDIPAPLLTQAIFDRGQIAVYRKFTSHGSTFTEQISGTFLTYGIYYWAVVGEIQIRTLDYDIGLEEDEAFRYVLIPGGVQANLTVDLQDFSQVKALFNIPD